MIMVRQAQEKDSDAILTLAKAFAISFSVEEGAFRQSFTALLNDVSAAVEVAEAGDQVVGYLLGFSHDSFFAGGPVGWVEEVMVAPECRTKGVGRALMQSFEAWARGRKCKLIALATRRAAGFYRALSFEESATYFRKVLG